MKRIKLFLAIYISFFLIVPAGALADAIGTVTYIEGRVDKLDPQEGLYLPVSIGDKVATLDTVRTKSYSKVEVTFDDNSIVRLGANSRIKIKNYDIDEYGYRKNASIDLDRGSMRAIVSKAKEKTAFDINTPNTSGRVLGSDIFVTYQQSATGVLVAEGMLKTVNPTFPDEIVNIREGNASFVPHNGPPQQPRIYLPMEKERYELETGPRIIEIEESAEITRAKVVRLKGSVRIQPSQTESWHAPQINEVLNIGDKIVTGEDGQIEISLDNGHILQLRENTQIIISLLTRDPKTGDYDNLFECEYGKVVAKISKIKENSSFKIKTPTATCGVRGTIMYLEVLPTLTKVFFEGGDGYIESFMSGLTKIIKAGQTGWGDGQGNLGDPKDTTDNDRENFGSGWGSEDGDTYGYTPPGGGAGGGLGGPGGTGGFTSPGGTSVEWPFEKIKPYTTTSSGGTGTTGIQVAEIIVGAGEGGFSGFGEIGGFLVGENLSFEGDDFGTWNSLFAGTYQPPRGTLIPETSWNLELVGVVFNSEILNLLGQDTSTTDISDDIINFNQLLQSYWFGEINGPSWSLGNLSGDFNGIWLNHDSGSFAFGSISGGVDGEYIDIVAPDTEGTWQAIGSGDWVEVSDLINDLDILTSQIEGVAGFDIVSIPITETLTAFGSDCYGGILSASMDITRFAHDSGTSGLWAALISGTYNTEAPPVGDDWSITFTTGDDSALDIHGVEWSQTTNEWSAGVTGSIDGCNLAGTAAGTYDGSGNFDGAGAGIWTSATPVVNNIQETSIE